MTGDRWPAVVGSIVIGFVAIVVSVLASAGWAVLVLGAGAAALLILLFVRGERAERAGEDEPGPPDSTLT